MERDMSNLNIGEEESGHLELEVPPTMEVLEDRGLRFLGRFAADTPINFLSMRNRLAVLWRPVKGVEIQEIYDKESVQSLNEANIGKLGVVIFIISKPYVPSHIQLADLLTNILANPEMARVLK
ncbi:uncharacterized protein [Euphorbia lathyris]|uniref:uncharacterized protein n=1 Tax=Euphorbia lathyris TaxID=212925 RepID=UPI003313FBE6